jgi:hypothetical protein
MTLGIAKATTYPIYRIDELSCEIVVEEEQPVSIPDILYTLPQALPRL